MTDYQKNPLGHCYITSKDMISQESVNTRICCSAAEVLKFKESCFGEAEDTSHRYESKGQIQRCIFYQTRLQGMSKFAARTPYQYNNHHRDWPEIMNHSVSIKLESRDSLWSMLNIIRGL